MTTVLREEALAHFGVKGMKWGRRRKSSTPASSPAKASEPKRTHNPNYFTTDTPESRRSTDIREMAKKAQPRFEPKNQSREEALLARSANNALDRIAEPRVDQFISNMPRHSIANADPAVAALLNRSTNQAIDRVRMEAGREFIEGMPGWQRR